jgi:hypothetical protein
MRAMFTIHAGEYLVGSHIEKNMDGSNVWIPSKDKGVDLLVTDAENTKAVSIQVKYSKDFLPTHRMRRTIEEHFKACGFWSLNREKMEKQPQADFWVLVLPSFRDREVQYVIIEPTELMARLMALRGNVTNLKTRLWITNDGGCWETRNLGKADIDAIALHRYKSKDRNFKSYLNNWPAIIQRLK